MDQFKLLNRSLIERISFDNDLKAFNEFFNHNYPKLFNFSYFFVKNNFYSEEIVSNVFVKIWNNRKNLVNIRNLNVYLYTLIKRESLNYLRDNKIGLSSETISIYSEIKLSSFNPEDELLHEEMLQYIQDTIKNLPLKCRLIYQMIKEDGLKYREVAAELDISKKSVEMHMSKALKLIRSAIIEYNSTPSVNKLFIFFLLLI